MKNLIALILFIPLFGYGQNTHTVQAKETLYSLGRQYNIHPRLLADYNNIPFETGLTIGQVLKIPEKSGATVITPDPVKPAPVASSIVKSGIPVYHKVQKKETLYGISKQYNKISIDDIRRWNNLQGDGLTEGIDLIVGYQKGTVESVHPAPAKKINSPADKQAVEKTVASSSSKPEAEEKVIPVKPAPEQPAKELKEEMIIRKAEPVKEQRMENTGKNFDGGFFRGLYNTQTGDKKDLSEETGVAAHFKSTSGWEDGKYYCLYNAAPSGTIVKITNKSTQRSVYAKVLDIIPDLKQNSGILIRLSNAAADQLGAGVNNFDAVIIF